MFRLFKLSVVLAAAAALMYVTFRVSLGERTLGGHIEAISNTEEAQSLKSEIGKKIDGVAGDLKRRASKEALGRLDKKIEEELGKDEDDMREGSPSKADRKALDELIVRKNSEAESEGDKKALDRLIRKKSGRDE